MADPFGVSGGGAHAGDPFNVGGSSGSSSSSSKKKHGGFLGAIENAAHVAAQKTELAARDIKGIPGGVVDQANVAVVQPWKDVLTTGHVKKKTGRNIDKLIQQTADSTAATLNHPGRDPFATALLLSPALHGAGRVATGGAMAGRALKAGEGAKAAVKAARTRPEDIPRSLRSGSKDTALIPSRNAAARIGQHVYDKTLQHALDNHPTGRIAGHAQKRVGGALKEEARTQQKMRAAPAALLDKAAGKLSKAPRTRRDQQAALELTSVQTTPEEAAAYHRAQAAKGVNPKRNEDVARIYDRVAARDLVHLDESKPAGQRVFINPAHERLAKADERLARVQNRGDEILTEKGVRSGEALEARRNAPGRVRAGAAYEKPTPAKQGVVSPALKRERSRLASLQRRLDDTLSREEEHLAKSSARDLGPLSENDAKARLHELNQQYDALVKKVVPEVSPYGGKVSQQEQLVRNFENSRVGKGKMRGASRRQTVSAEERTLADEKLRSLVEKHPGKPQVEKLAALLEERDRLRSSLNARGEAALAGDEAPSLPSAPASAHRIPAASNPYRNRIVRLGHAVEAQQKRVATMEKAAANRVKPTGIVGGESARPGRGFTSYRASEKKLSRSEAAAARGPVVGAAKPPIDSKPFTGRSIEHGFVPKHVTAAASRHFRQIIRFVNTDAHRRAALETGSDTRRSDRDILVRIPDVPAGKLSAELQQTLGRERSNVDTAEELATQEGLKAAHEAFLEGMFRPGELKAKFAGDRGQGIGTKAPDGYRWVDKNALGDLLSAPPGQRWWITRRADDINSAVTAATVYFKVGHVGTRVLTNAATNIIQGSAAPLQMKKSIKLWNRLSDEEKVRALGASGQHGFASLPHEGTNLVSRVAGAGAQWWAKHADSMFRFNSLAYELRKIGVKTPDEFRKALDGIESGGQGLPAHEWSKLSAATRRADREAISYDRLNEFEKRFLSRAIWFYPWVKGSTLFTVRTAIEHPYKAGYLGATGTLGRQVQEQQLGPTPTYEAGLVKLFGGGNTPVTADFSTFSPFATAADLATGVTQPGGIAEQLNPVAGVGGQVVYGLNRFNEPTSSYLDALSGLGSATPEQQLAEAYAARNEDQSNRIFHKTLLNTLARYAVGPALPRTANRSALAKAARNEKIGRR